MSKKLTKKDEEELQSLIDDVISEAKEVRLNYEERPSDISGSIVQIHEDSPYLATREERLITFDGKKIKVKPDKKA